ncbi:UvrD-helicase domain-containing protein [Candidatus Parcubacteria bacterium]|nr:UvrD-helicase domain-containing protein [Candidatus Parcubacteria bacterium]
MPQLKKLNPEQEKAVKWKDGPVLIIAGAGTGKTTALTRRIAWLIEQKIAKPEEILGLTFTEKAAEEMDNRVNQLLPIGYSELWISTFHSFCDRILKQHGLDIGLSTDFKVLDDVQSWLLFRQNLSQFNLDYYRPLGNPTKFIRVLLNHFSRCKDEEICPEDYLKYSDDLRLNMDEIAVGSKAIKSKDKKEIAQIQQEADRIKEVAEAYFLYQKLLLDNNSLDFGDLINYCLKLFKTRPKILEKYRKQFKYILVDEFQDTNWAQYELVKLLAFPKNNLAVSADDDQSLYLWRGSSFNNVLRFRKDFPDTKEIILIRNYRSPQNILDLSYKFIQLNNPNRLEYQLNEAGKINKKLIACEKDKGVIEVLCFKTLEQEARGVVEKIAQILKQDKEANFNDFAILVRANNNAQPFCKELERNGFPYQFLASKGLYSKPVILDIISYLKLLNNCYENSAFYRVLNCPCFKISSEEIAKITQHSHRKGQSIYETLQQIPLSSELNFLLGLIKKHRAEVKKKNISEIFVLFLKESGYLKKLVKKEKETELNLINQFYNKIKKFEQSQADPILNSFIEQLNLELESGEQGSLEIDAQEGPDMIKILTIHKAKGLEFKYVFLVNLVDKRFPSLERKEPIEIPEKLIKEIIPEGDIHLQEERRLFYVGMTRAKKGLFFAWADDYGGNRKKKPSRFLIECGLEKDGKEIKETLMHEIHSAQTRHNFADVGGSVAGKNSKKSLIPSYFSYSQIAAFQKCPLQYKFAHILKIPRQGSAAFSFGRTMHQTLYEFLKTIQQGADARQASIFPDTNEPKSSEEKTCLNFQNLLEIYKKNWIDEWYENKPQKEKYFKQGKKSLKIFYNDFLKNQPNIQIINKKPALEQSFNLKIGDWSLIGKIDRIDALSNKNKVEIIDYKTGKAKDKLKPEEKQQLLIYQIATEESLGLNPVKLTYYYLENCKTISFLSSEKEKQNFKEKLLELLNKIKNSDFKPTPGWNCRFCDFKDICEYKQ